MKRVRKVPTYYFIKDLFGLFILLVFSLSGFSQNVGISPTGATVPNAAAGLDVNFASKGLLIPRVTLQDTANFLPLTSHIAGMLVYNTATPVGGNVTPGFYYNSGSAWISGLPNKANAAGDIQYWNGTGWINITIGLVGQRLQINATGIPVWAP